MRTLFLALALLAAVPAAGCAQLAGLSKNEQIATFDEKAMLLVENGYAVALDVVETAALSGLIKPGLAAQLGPVLDKAEAAVNKARAAYAQGVALEQSAATAQAFAAVAQLTDALRAAGL